MSADLHNPPYVELHCHSNFSLLDGASPPEELIKTAAASGMTALAITDHDGLYSASVFYRKAKAAGIKPVIGAELTLDGGFHITLLTENRTGYTNLCRLITRSQMAHSKGNPSLPLSDLAGNTAGLICLSGCKKGEVPCFLKSGEKEKAATAARKYRSLFGKDHFYIEIQHHLCPDDTWLCTQLAGLAEALNIKVVATNNVHYALRKGFMLHDVLACIKNRVPIDNSSAFRRLNSEYYLKTCRDMSLLAGITPQSILCTGEIARRCEVDLDFSPYAFPDYPLPPGRTSTQYLRPLAFERARQKFGELTGDITERLNHELFLIDTKGLAGYFLVVWDIMEFAKSEGILAQGRGSAASSLVAYVLGITPVDPLQHRLFVGRFLNEGAIPDIDIDIATHRRDEVIRYVYEKYGTDHAAMVCTYVTFQARNAVREVGKVLGLPAPMLDRMARSLSSYGGSNAIDSLREVPEFRQYLDTPAWRHFCDLCREIADFPRHLSIHVGGMIVSSRPISDMVPLEHARAEGRVVCQWDKDGVDDAGFIKVDLLGLRMLSMIDGITGLIRRRRGIEASYDALPPDDPQVYGLIEKADTIGVFQVESRAQMQALPKVKPRSIEDLAVEIAIIRPGPLQGNMVHPYVRRRQRKEPINHLHPRLAPILDETLGVILFQEQILQVACEVAGFSTGEANNLRKAMARKEAKTELQKWYRRFLSGAEAQGIDGATARAIFQHIGAFAGFGFCKSHAASFAILSYASAFYKLYYPAEFFCALLNNQPMGFYMPEVIVEDAKRHGVVISPVDIHKSEWDCSIEDEAVRVGFRYVKGLGSERVRLVLAERARAPFSSLRDFAVRTGLDRDSLQNLIITGAFDDMNSSRRQLLWEMGTLRLTAFPAIGGVAAEEVLPDEMTEDEEIIHTYATQGFSSSHHLVEIFRKGLTESGAVTSAQLDFHETGESVCIGGYCVCLQRPGTAKGFTFLTLEDEKGLANVVLKPDIYNKYRALVRLEPLLFVEGKVEKKDGIINILARKVKKLDFFNN